MSICASYFDFGVVCVINDYIMIMERRKEIGLICLGARVAWNWTRLASKKEKREKKIGEDVSRGKRREGMRVRHLFPPSLATSHSKNDRV